MKLQVLVQQKTTGELKQFITPRSWKEYTVCLKEAHEEFQAEPGAHAFFRVCGWTVLGFLG